MKTFYSFDSLGICWEKWELPSQNTFFVHIRVQMEKELKRHWMLNCCTNALGLCCNCPWSTWSSVIKIVPCDVSENVSKSPVQWVCLRQSVTLLEEEFLILKLLLRAMQTFPPNSQKLMKALTELKEHSHFSLCKLSWTQYLKFSYFHYWHNTQDCTL